MTLPINLVIVRHGESEGNAAKRRSEKGDHDDIKKLRERHTASYRLTARGRDQARAAGAWLRKEFYKEGHPGFDDLYTSEYVRAMETAALLNLPNAHWRFDPYLYERDWGDMRAYPEDERQKLFGESLRIRDIEPGFWRPPNGESNAEARLRVDRGSFFRLHRESSDKNVCWVCHGDIIRVCRLVLEHMSQLSFRAIALSEDPNDRIFNCQILHYTRRNPVTGELSDHVDWFRMVRPTENPIWDTGWQTVERPRYSNEDLLQIVEAVPPDVT